MYQILQKIPFLFELFFNGTFILFYSMRTMNRVPANWSIELIDNGLKFGAKVVPFIILMSMIVNFISGKGIEDFLRKHVFSILVFVPLMITWGDLEFAFGLCSAHLIASVLSLYDDDKGGTIDLIEERVIRSSSEILGVKLKPAQLVLLSFAAVIFIGAFLLKLPVSSATGKSIDFIDALFMATSATCVTGLSSISLASDLSLFGQIVILILIQIGGLSIMTLYSSMTILLGKSMRMKDRIIMQDLLDVSSLEELFRMIIDIITYTLMIELWGAIVLTIAFTFEGFEFSKAIYFGFYHSISAFCNAGFALFDNSLESYATSPLIHGTIAILITLGGLGFITLKELKEVIVKKKSIVRLGVHSKVVLVTSFFLTMSGFVIIFFGEFLNALDNYTLWEKIQISMFQSVTLRTAGFNTIPMTSLNNYTIFAMILYMFIGGSPGSTAGGIKTSTLAILVQSIRSTLSGHKDVTVFDRKIPSQIVVRSIALTFISVFIASFFVFLMMKLEPEQGFLPLVFEVFSASGTVGLSLGITGYLSFMGKLAISVLMLIGRIGPLTLILAIGEKSAGQSKADYPHGRIMIG